MSNELVTSPQNRCPSAKEYKMLPIKPGTPVIKRAPKAPKLGPNDPLVHFRILKIEDNVATICEDMTKLVDGHLMVRDVDISRLGRNGVKLGDIIGFKESDAAFSRPLITHRKSQQHQHPEKLIAESER